MHWPSHCSAAELHTAQATGVSACVPTCNELLTAVPHKPLYLAVVKALDLLAEAVGVGAHLQLRNEAVAPLAALTALAS